MVYFETFHYSYTVFFFFLFFDVVQIMCFDIIGVIIFNSI